VSALPRAPGGFRSLFVTIDIFIKWMEAMLVVNSTQDAAVKFLQSIIYRFGVPKWVLIDNVTQFKGETLQDVVQTLVCIIKHRQQHILRQMS
jgi:hypothetical protein